MASLRAAGPDDIPEVVRVHIAAFPGFFLTELGPRFLALYYTEVLQYETGILLVAEEGDRLAGFVAGALRPSGIYRALKRDKVRIGLTLVPALLRRPALMGRALANFRRTADDGATADDDAAAELTSVAVDPGASHRGVGQALVNAFVGVARSRGALLIHLSTDAEGNDRVNEFYKRLGFKLARTFTAPVNRVMNEYHYTFPEGEQ